MAVFLREGLDIIGDITNGRDGASEPIIQRHKEAVEGLDMLIKKYKDADRRKD